MDSTPRGKELGQFDCGGTNHGIYRTEKGYKILISDTDGQIACAMETEDNFAVCRITPFGELHQRRFGLGNALMIAFAFAAANYNTLLMHASVTMYDEKGCFPFDHGSYNSQSDSKTSFIRYSEFDKVR